MSNRHDTAADRAERSIKRDAIKDAIGKLTGTVDTGAQEKAEQESPKSDAKPGSTRTP